MAAFTTMAIVGGLALAGAGTYMNYQGQKKQQAAQDEALAQQQQLERKRQQQMELDAARRKRELVRTQLAARSQSLAVATAQGAANSGSSALGGAYGSIAGRTGVNELGINQNLELGRQMFGLNEGILGSYRSAAQGAGMSAFGSGLTSLGGALISNAGVIDRVGTYFSNGSGGSGGYDSSGTPSMSYGPRGPR